MPLVQIKSLVDIWGVDQASVVHCCYLLEWMPFIRLLNGLQDALVYPEGDGDREEGQAHVGTHADDAAHRQGQQQEEAGAKHHARGFDITPVQEPHHWNKGRELGTLQRDVH